MTLRTNFIAMVSTERAKRNGLRRDDRLRSYRARLTLFLVRNHLHLPTATTPTNKLAARRNRHPLNIIDTSIVRRRTRRLEQVIFRRVRSAIRGVVPTTLLRGTRGNLARKVIRRTIRLLPRRVTTAITMTFLTTNIFPRLTRRGNVKISPFRPTPRNFWRLIQRLVHRVRPPTNNANNRPANNGTILTISMVRGKKHRLLRLKRNLRPPPETMVVEPATRIVPPNVKKHEQVVHPLTKVATVTVRVRTVHTNITRRTIRRRPSTTLFHHLNRTTRYHLIPRGEIGIYVIHNIMTIVKINLRGQIRVRTNSTRKLRVIRLSHSTIRIATRVIIIPRPALLIQLPFRQLIPTIIRRAIDQRAHFQLIQFNGAIKGGLMRRATNRPVKNNGPHLVTNRLPGKTKKNMKVTHNAIKTAGGPPNTRNRLRLRTVPVRPNTNKNMTGVPPLIILPFRTNPMRPRLTAKRPLTIRR